MVLHFYMPSACCGFDLAVRQATGRNHQEVTTFGTWASWSWKALSEVFSDGPFLKWNRIISGWKRSSIMPLHPFLDGDRMLCVGGSHFHVLGIKISVWLVISQCTMCRCYSAKPSQQMFGQLPLDGVTPGTMFEKVGVDYAGPLQVKYTWVTHNLSLWRPTFVSLFHWLWRLFTWKWFQS